ncbi:hypothetical protein OUZ56_007794 [Daphnia magna]|uniref:Uncharacterized protein n=1 Tax=Daphnia magna TaxID=35525 RepID=A0ABR0AB12_9CRUS|nr:hypothetical protein OUZ56_007794 [Daphnia magna]
MMIFQKNKNRKQKRRVKFGKETEEAEAAALRCCSGMRFAARTTPVSHGRPAAFRYYPTSSSSLLWPTSSSPPPTSTVARYANRLWPEQKGQATAAYKKKILFEKKKKNAGESSLGFLPISIEQCWKIPKFL